MAAKRKSSEPLLPFDEETSDGQSNGHMNGQSNGHVNGDGRVLPTPGAGIAPKTTRCMTFRGKVPTDTLDLRDLGTKIKIIAERHGELTWAKAEEIMNTQDFAVGAALIDRNLLSVWGTYLLQIMQQNTFRPEHVTIATCVCREKNGDLPAGTEYRMNGKHTCWARAYMRKDWPCRVTFRRYEAATVADMRTLYSSFDRGKGRSYGNVIYSYLGGLPQFLGVNRRVLSLLADGMKLWLWEGTEEQSGHTLEEVVYHITHTHEHLTASVGQFFVVNNLSKHEYGFMRRAPVFAAALETFTKVQRDSADFWASVRSGVDIKSVNDARMRLRSWLQHSSLSTVGGRRCNLTNEGMYRGCVECFNAWRKNREISSVRVSLRGRRPKAI